MMALIFIWMSFGLMTALVASSKGSDPLFWALIGAGFGPFGLIACFISGRTCPYCESKINRRLRVCPKCNADLPPPHAWSESAENKWDDE